ncbi:MAG: L-rhamnose isomerase, partial [Defluviitaleaceae bacterium]|nr:L-rhamnose isomerase [Defluviitaleaceae bacterium]
HGAERVLIGLDFFDASINRVAAWVIGVRNMQKALLSALLTPHKKLADMQSAGRNTEIFMLQEELKTLPFGQIWDEFCAQNNVPVGIKWYEEIEKYEKEHLTGR